MKLLKTILIVAASCVILFGCKSNSGNVLDMRTIENYSLNVVEEPVQVEAKVVEAVPNPYVANIEVVTGERVSSLVLRLADMGLVTVKAFEEVSYRTDISDSFSLVPDFVTGSQKFEGLFVPGEYEIMGLTEPELADTSEEHEQNARLIIDCLYKSAMIRFGDLTEIKGLTPYQFVALASIVEKEDAFNDSASVIASVFWNRVLTNNRLGSCVTAEYVLGFHRPFLYTVDLESVRDSPWNTYYHKGLPPTPICFVSDYTLDETANSEDTNYYYFVMDWGEKMILPSETYEGHKQNIKVAKASVINTFGEEILHQRMDDYYYDYFAKNSM